MSDELRDATKQALEACQREGHEQFNAWYLTDAVLAALRTCLAEKPEAIEELGWRWFTKVRAGHDEEGFSSARDTWPHPSDAFRAGWAARAALPGPDARRTNDPLGVTFPPFAAPGGRAEEAERRARSNK